MNTSRPLYQINDKVKISEEVVDVDSSGNLFEEVVVQRGRIVSSKWNDFLGCYDYIVDVGFAKYNYAEFSIERDD